MNTGALWDVKLLKLHLSFSHVKVYTAWILHIMVLDGFEKNHTSQKAIINCQKGFSILED